MFSYALRRIAVVIPTLFVIVTLSFFVIRLAPGGPFDQEQSLSPEVRANLQAAYGLDEPLISQYVRYMSGIAHGNLGFSFRFRDFTVAEIIAQGLPVSLTLGFASLVLALVLGIPAGVLAALHRNTIVDHCSMGLAILGVAAPSFVVGPLLALTFGLYLHWLPVAGWERDFQHLVLPIVTLALPILASIARLTRGSLLEVLRAGFVRTARAKGMGEWRVIWRHALRPALLPVVSYLGPAAAATLTGSLVVETVFALPGCGRFLVEGAIDRDYALVMGMVIIYGAVTLLCNLVADLVHHWLDPRTRYE
jgi:oligopeptide transport system permease protein